MNQKSTTQLPAALTYGTVLGQIIVRRRQLAGLQQQALAEMLGISQSAYSRLESGQSAMSVNQLYAISARFGILPSDLLAETDRHVQQLQASGVAVTDGKANNASELLIGLGILAALIASAR
jgi:transcriptional regulator with XRE-family HTH domain